LAEEDVSIDLSQLGGDSSTHFLRLLARCSSCRNDVANDGNSRYSEGDNDWVPRTKRSGSRSGLGLNRVCVLRALGTVLGSLQTGIALNHFQWTIRGLQKCFLTGSFTYDCGTVRELRGKWNII